MGVVRGGWALGVRDRGSEGQGSLEMDCGQQGLAGRHEGKRQDSVNEPRGGSLIRLHGQDSVNEPGGGSLIRLHGQVRTQGRGSGPLEGVRGVIGELLGELWESFRERSARRLVENLLNVDLLWGQKGVRAFRCSPLPFPGRPIFRTDPLADVR